MQMTISQALGNTHLALVPSQMAKIVMTQWGNENDVAVPEAV